MDLLKEIWMGIGLEVNCHYHLPSVTQLQPQECLERKGEVTNLVRNLFGSMIEQEREQMRALEESVRVEKRNLQELCLELDMAFNPVLP